jgi:hypothetical protein
MFPVLGADPSGEGTKNATAIGDSASPMRAAAADVDGTSANLLSRQNTKYQPTAAAITATDAMT